MAVSQSVTSKLIECLTVDKIDETLVLKTIHDVVNAAGTRHVNQDLENEDGLFNNRFHDDEDLKAIQKDLCLRILLEAVLKEVDLDDSGLGDGSEDEDETMLVMMLMLNEDIKTLRLYVDDSFEASDLLTSITKMVRVSKLSDDEQKPALVCWNDLRKRILDWSQKIENSPSCPRAQPIQEKEESQIENLIKYPILAISKLYDELGPSVSQHVVDEAAEEVFVSDDKETGGKVVFTAEQDQPIDQPIDQPMDQENSQEEQDSEKNRKEEFSKGAQLSQEKNEEPRQQKRGVSLQQQQQQQQQRCPSTSRDSSSPEKEAEDDSVDVKNSSSDEEKLEPSRFPSTERAGPKSPQEVNPAREKRWIQTRLQMKKGLSFVNPSEDLSEDKASKISRQSTRRSIRIEYTEEETETLRKGVEEFGLSWKEILKKYSNIFSPNERTVQKLKSHWRYLKRKSKSEKHEIRKMIKANPKISKYMMQKKNNLKTTFATKNLDSEFEETMKRDMSGDQKLSSKAPLQRSARKEVGSTKIEKRFKGLHGKISAAPELRNASKAARTRKEDKNDVPGGEKAKASIRWWTPKEDEALREGVENQRGNKMISWVYILKNYSQIFSPNKRSPRALKLHWLYSRKERELRQQNK